MKFFYLFFILFFTGCNHLYYYPSKDTFYPPEKFKLKYEPLELKSKDGTKIAAWYFPASGRAKGTVLQFHGNAQNMSTHYLSLVWLVQYGYNLMTFDYRGYGKSEGKPNPKGTYLDGLVALDQAWQIHSKGGGRFIVVGQSLGGAVAMRSLQDFEHREKVSLLILDSTFYSYRKVAYTIMRKSWLGTVLSPFAWLLVSDQYGGKKFLKENKIPTLVLHDRNDPIVPFENGLRVYEQLRSPKEFWEYSIGRHVGSLYDDQVTERKKLLSYLERF